MLTSDKMFTSRFPFVKQPPAKTENEPFDPVEAFREVCVRENL